MLFYPNYQEEEDYLQMCVAKYCKAYPMFSEEQIKKPIELVIIFLKTILDNSFLVPKPIMRFRNAELLGAIFELSQEQFLKKRKRPEITFNSLIGLTTGKPDIVKFVLKEKEVNFPVFESEKYLEFIAKMTKECSKSIADVMIRNTSYEVKREAAQEQAKQPLSTARESIFSDKKRTREGMPSSNEVKRPRFSEG